PVIQFVKQAFSDPMDFTNFLALATGATKQAALGGGKLAEFLNKILARSPIDPALRSGGRAARSVIQGIAGYPMGQNLKTTPLGRHTIAIGTPAAGTAAWLMMRNKPQPGGGGPPPVAP